MQLAYLLVLILLPNSAISEESTPCEDGSDCIAENSWHIGLAIGLGGRTNPLVDGDNIPLVVIPDIAYYAESVYFDNGELGWQFTPSTATSLEIFVAPNTEKANFSFWHTANILIPTTAFDSDITIDEPTQSPHRDSISIDEVSSRKWALDAGVRWQWYGDNHHISIALSRDVSGVYNGSHATVKYQYLTTFGDWKISLSPHLKWHSGALSNYYYGISEDDTEIGTLTYEARSGFQFGMSINSGYKINDDWQALFRVSGTQLHSGMTDSPLVEDNSIYSAFAGIAYRF